MSFFSLPDAIIRAPCDSDTQFVQIMDQIQDSLAFTFGVDNKTILPTIYTAVELLYKAQPSEQALQAKQVNYLTEQDWKMKTNLTWTDADLRIPVFKRMRHLGSLVANHVTDLYAECGLKQLYVPRMNVDMSTEAYKRAGDTAKLALQDIAVNSPEWDALTVKGKQIVADQDVRVLNMYCHFVDRMLYTMTMIVQMPSHWSHKEQLSHTLNLNIGILMHVQYILNYIALSMDSYPDKTGRMADAIVHKTYSEMFETINPGPLVQTSYDAVGSIVANGLWFAFPDRAGDIFFGARSFMRRIMAMGQETSTIIRGMVPSVEQLRDLRSTIRDEVNQWMHDGRCDLMPDLQSEEGLEYRQRVINHIKMQDEWWQQEEEDVIQPTKKRRQPSGVAESKKGAEPDVESSDSDEESASGGGGGAEPNATPLMYIAPPNDVSLEEMHAFFLSCVPLPITAPWTHMPRRNTRECALLISRMRNHLNGELAAHAIVDHTAQTLDAFLARPGGRDFLMGLIRDVYVFAHELCAVHRIPAIEIGHAVFLWKLMLWLNPQHAIADPNDDRVWRFAWEGRQYWLLVVADRDENPNSSTIWCQRAYNAYNRHKMYSLIPAATQELDENDFGVLLDIRPQPVSPRIADLLHTQIKLRVEYYSSRCNVYAGRLPVLHQDVYRMVLAICDALRNV